ncbi:uncharacterized protein LOC132936054 [Metopolophium dirhodum]|uniref:uncharacterized protein LOC132936054 n=1 Tax=Metopolophium dirhodum TaxID=44670 RepID=UPI00298FC5BD|nr:uncharacterized protein LOC132936054 [Metopolophium dirhodum]
MKNYGLEDDLVTVMSNQNNDFEEQTLKPLSVLIRCSVHTLQLCVEDALKSTSDQKLVSKMREIVKKLRTPTVIRMIKGLHPKAKEAIIDVETRWSSSYVSNTFKELNVTDNQWQKTEILVKALLPAKQATVQLQKEDLTIGDFYGIWLKCCRDTKKVGSGFSKILSTLMEKREKLLLDNPIFLAGIYLDPRFQCLPNDDSKYKAINILVDVWKMILWLDKNSMPISNNEIIESATHCEVDNHNFSNVEDDDLENFIKTKTYISIQEQNESVEAIPIRLLLQSYDNIQRLHHSTSIRQYWQDLKLIKPEIFRLAQVSALSVSLSVPVTQVSTQHFWIINNCTL